MGKWTRVLAAVGAVALLFAGCGGSAAPAETQPTESSQAEDPAPETDPAADGEVTLLVAAAASLEYSFKDELIPLFRERYPHIAVEGTYDASGKLQTQIEEGLAADVFMSAATKQMDALDEAGLIEEGSVVELLENRIVLIAPADGETVVDSFETIGQAETIAIGDPDSVPAGQYAREALTSLGVYDEIQPKLSLGTNVTEVLNWVAEGSADVGIVYATDAATSERVRVLAEAPAGSLAQTVIYPVGVMAASPHKEEAQLFVEFLASPEALAVFERYGFTPNQ